MLATRNTITQYIPQRSPMVMIHDLMEANDQHVITQFAIEPDNVFTDNGFFSEPGLVENIAQTAAVQIGYQCAQKKIPIPIGYIAAIRELIIHHLPKQNSMVTTSVRVTNKVLDVTVVEGKVEQNGIILCSCEMRIFVKIQS